MSLTLWAGRRPFPVGSSSFLKAFFSTIFIRLEDETWGSRYPVVMHDLYAGCVPHEKAEAASEEIARIREALAEFGTNRVVWDFEDRSTRPPWDDDISPDIKSLADYFVTSDGKSLLNVLQDAFEEARRSRCNVEVK